MKNFTMQYSSVSPCLRSLSLALLFIGLTGGITLANGPAEIRLSGYPGTFSTLQAAISQAKTGDEVFVPAGNYGEVVVRSGILLNPEGQVHLAGLKVCAPGEVVRLGGNFNVDGLLDMQSGLLDVGAYSLRANSVAGGSDNSYVVAVQPGELRVIGSVSDKPVILPVGTIAEFMPQVKTSEEAVIASLADSRGTNDDAVSNRSELTCPTSIAINISTSSPYCANTSSTLSVVPTGGSFSGSETYSWSTSNGRADIPNNTLASPGVDYILPGSVTLRVTVTDGGSCTVSALLPITISASPSTPIIGAPIPSTEMNVGDSIFLTASPAGNTRLWTDS
ncbi:MAG: hypothetical protein ACKOCO_12135, partial [Bacteroidota bacterium]